MRAGRSSERQVVLTVFHPDHLVGEPPGAQLSVGNISGAHFGTAGGRIPDRPKQAVRVGHRLGRIGAVQPQFACQGGIPAKHRRVGGSGQGGVVVAAASTEHGAQRRILDEAGHIEVGEVTDRLQVRDIVFQRLDQRWLERGIERGAAGTVVEVDHFLRQPAALGDDAGRLQWLLVEEVVASSCACRNAPSTSG